MPAIRLDGRAIAQENEGWLRDRVAVLKSRSGGQPPCLATILVGDHKPSQVYIRFKREACQRVGIESIARVLPTQTTTAELIAEIDSLNRDPKCHGILLQHPVPRHIDELGCFDAIDPEKDVDGVSSLGYARMVRRQRAYACATPGGIMRLLRIYGIDVSGLNAVVVGRSPILGAPMAAMLTLANATVTICHSRTRDLKRHIAGAELLVAGIGKPHFITPDCIADGAIVIDAGYNPDGRGDVAIDDDLRARARAYTPVPGCVGPMTINTLLNQTYASACRHMLREEAESEPSSYRAVQG